MKKIEIRKEKIEIFLTEITKEDVHDLMQQITAVFGYKRAFSAEHKEALSKAGKGRVFSEEHKVRLSKKLKEAWITKRKALASSSETK